MTAAAAGVTFAEVQRVLALFVEGLHGRSLHLKPLDAPSVDGRIKRNATDGESIVLPAAVADFAVRRHNVGAYRIAALHQLGYLEGGTFAFDIDVAAARIGLPADMLARLDNSALPARLRPQRWVAPLERLFAAHARPGLFRRVFVTLEDWRIDSAMRRRYPGARADLDRVLAHALAARADPAAMRLLAGLVESLVQRSLGADEAALLARDRSGVLGEALGHAHAVEAAGASVYDTVRAALSVCAVLEAVIRRARTRVGPLDEEWDEDIPLPELATPSAAGDEPGGDGEGEAEPAEIDLDGTGIEFRGDLLPMLVHQKLVGGQLGMTAQDLAAMEVPEGTPLEEGAPEDGRRGTASLRRRTRGEGPRSSLYDEWDYLNQAYLPAWCRVYEQRLVGDDHGFIGAVRRRHSALFGQVRRRFLAIRPESWLRVHRASDGPELELDGVIEAVIDRRAGHATDEHLYVRRERGLRDVAAAFLVDMSASTDFPVPDENDKPRSAEPQSTEGVYLWAGHDAAAAPPPVASKRRVIDVAKDALALMSDALTSLGDPHAIYGFSGAGRDNVEFHVAKDFGDRVSARTWAALGAIEPRGSTRMGPAIRHALTKLAHQAVATRVLIIVSDGYPEDRDYGPDRRDDEYGIQDTAQALKEAAAAGVTAFCVTIDPAGHDYLKRMCAPDRYMVIDEVAALPEALVKVYRELTA